MLVLACAATAAATYLVADPRGARAAGKKEGERIGQRSANELAAAKQADLTEFQRDVHESDLNGLRAQLRQARRNANALYAQGGSDAFGQFNTPWQNNSHYVVNVEAGAGGLAHAITSRTEPMEFGWSYYLCPGGDNGSVCMSPSAPTG